MSTQPAIPQRIATDDHLLDTLGGKLADTNPATDSLTDFLVAWRREIDSTEARPAITDYIAELARREHIELEVLRRDQFAATDLRVIEDLARRARDAVVVKRFLNTELDTLRQRGAM